MHEKPAISSRVLSMNAYKKSKGKFPFFKSTNTEAPDSRGYGKKYRYQTHSLEATRELKALILKSLQTRSNGGKVKLRDVAIVLDHILKKPR